MFKTDSIQLKDWLDIPVEYLPTKTENIIINISETGCTVIFKMLNSESAKCLKTLVRKYLY